MLIEVGKYSKLTFQVITITHPNEPELNFDGGGYRTARMVQRSHPLDDDTDDDLFKEVNEFLQRLDKDQQQKLFDCYARTDGLLQSYDNFNGDAVSMAHMSLEDNLKSIVRDIYRIVKFDDLLDYVRSNRDLKIPPELSDTYQTDDKITQAYVAKTYTLSEYIDLMALCLGLRFMIPIWGPYLNISKASEGNSMKEYHSFGLLRNSALYKSRAFDRMDTYIRANIDAKDQTMASTLHFLSSEEIPTYAIAMTAIRKLSIAPLSCDTDKHHLMKILYSFATNKIRSLDESLEPGLLSKTNRGIFVDDNSSVFCLFKMKEQLSSGEKMYIQEYILRYGSAAQAIEPDINPDMVADCVNTIYALKDWQPHEAQKALVSWVLSPVVTGSTIPLLDYRTLMAAIGITQAVLWHWGLHELAIIATGRVKPKDPNAFRAMGGKKKLSEDTLVRLDEIYPYKLSLSKHIPGGWADNSGVRGIELLHEQLSSEDWLVQCPKTLSKTNDDARVMGYIEPSGELRETIASMLFKLHDIVR